MSRLLASACAISIVLMISETVSLDRPGRGTTRQLESSPLFLFHLLKLKHKIQRIENIPTIPTTADCICIPHYLCDINGTVTPDKIGTIDIRYRRCTGDLEVCCRLVNATTTTTTTTTTTMRTTTTTKATTTTTKATTTTTKAPTTTTTTLPPIIFPNSESPNAEICVCVLVTQCDPNGIIGSSGEGVINPRIQYVQCPSSNQVCCMPTAVIQYPTTPPTARQICVLCGSTIQCSNGVVVPVNVGVVNPVVTYQQTCPVPTTCCQGINPIYNNGIPVVLGPVRYANTPQACYCVKSWLCAPGNSVSWDNAGAIDP
ncbi:mucin-2-like, partial [Hylaeus anthracinus]|uniref:mucin-2-like n=1 Tax=Hylaeus anthracinus TaxID=313031 RepID=UPI0023BA35D6